MKVYYKVVDNLLLTKIAVDETQLNQWDNEMILSTWISG